MPFWFPVSMSSRAPCAVVLTTAQSLEMKPFFWGERQLWWFNLSQQKSLVLSMGLPPGSHVSWQSRAVASFPLEREMTLQGLSQLGKGKKRYSAGCYVPK